MHNYDIGATVARMRADADMPAYQVTAKECGIVGYYDNLRIATEWARFYDGSVYDMVSGRYAY